MNHFTELSEKDLKRIDEHLEGQSFFDLESEHDKEISRLNQATRLVTARNKLDKALTERWNGNHSNGELDELATTLSKKSK